MLSTFRLPISYITTNWRGRPLVSHQVVVELIAATKTATGLEGDGEDLRIRNRITLETTEIWP
jgi:hypothetical protein